MSINKTDLIVGFDPTFATQISGAQLAQLVNSATPNTDRGFIIVSTDIGTNPVVPDAGNLGGNGNTNWQRYLWLRVSATYVTAYIWNPNGATDPVFENWVTVASAAIAPGSIQGYQIASNTIPSSAVISISSSQITGSVVAGWLASLNLNQTAIATNGLLSTNLFANGTLTWGDLVGNATTGIGFPSVAPLAITTPKIALQAVQGNATAGLSQIKDNSITSTQLLANNNNISTPVSAGATAAVDPVINITVPIKSIPGVPTNTNWNPQATGVNVAAGDVLAVNYNSTGQLAGFVPNRRAILTLAEPMVNNNTIQLPVVAIGQTAYSLANAQGAVIGRILQVSRTALITAVTPIAGLSTGNQITGANSTLLYTLSNFVPLNAGSNLLVRFDGYFKQVTNSGWNMLGIQKIAHGGSTAGNLDDANGSYNSADNNQTRYGFITHVYTNVSTAAVDINIYAVTSNNTTCTFNPQPGYTGVNNSAWLEVVEYI